MKYLVLCIMTLLIGTIAVSGQQEIWDKWNNALVEKANTAKNTSYYTNEEREVVLLMNLARIDGALFASTFLSHYIQSTGTNKNRYVNSLYRELKSVSNLPLLVPKKRSKLYCRWTCD